MITTELDFLDQPTGYDFDKKGKPLTWHESDRLRHDEKYKRIAETEFSDGTVVSTVWVCTDPHVDENGLPLIFETMVNYTDSWDMQRRYSSVVDALKGHCAMLEEVTSRIRDPEAWNRARAEPEINNILGILIVASALEKWTVPKTLDYRPANNK